MKLKLITLFLTLVLFVPSLSQVRRITPDVVSASKIKITGSMVYYGRTNYGYFSYSIDLTRDGRPVTNAKIEINNDKNTYNNNNGRGHISGSISPHIIKLGEKITIAVIFTNTLSKDPRKLTFNKKIILATLKVKNILKWVYPKPGEVIALPRFQLFVPFRWDFTGTSVKEEFYIRETGTNKKIYSVITDKESLRIPTRILRSGKEYKLGFWSNGPIDHFKISSNAARGSRVRFIFCNSMLFKVK